MFSKNERRTDTKTYGDKKALFDGVSWLAKMIGLIEVFFLFNTLYSLFRKRFIEFWHVSQL